MAAAASFKDSGCPRLQHLGEIDLAILSSGDSDYLSTVKEVQKAGKYVRIRSFKKSLSWELWSS